MKDIPRLSNHGVLLNAYNCLTGDYEWQVPLGNYPEKQKLSDIHTGAENWGGPIVTAGGLVFIAATKDEKFRAFDKSNGKMLWETDLPGWRLCYPYHLYGKRQSICNHCRHRHQ